MILWICGVLTLGAGLLACIMTDMRRAVLSLWVCSLGVGGIYLAMGAELLAIVQWIVSTVVAIAFIFYAVMFGEYVSRDRDSEKIPPSKRILQAVLPALIGAGFSTVIIFGANHLPTIQPVEVGPVPTLDGAQVVERKNVAVLGQVLTEHHFLSLEILGLMLFLVIVGSGVIARPERLEKKEGT